MHWTGGLAWWIMCPLFLKNVLIIAPWLVMTGVLLILQHQQLAYKAMAEAACG